MVVHLRDDRAGDVIRPLRFHDRVGEVERHAHARDLGRVDAVAAHTGRGVDDGLELHASLHELIADDETDVAAADHQNALTWLHTVQVHQRLRRARAHDAGQCPAVERDHIFHRARCDDDRVALVVRRLAVGVDEDLLVAVQAHDHRVEVNGDASGLRLFEQFLADVEAADLGVVLLRAEEFVDLLEQLSAGGGVLIENRDMYAVLCRLNGRRQSGRAGAHNDQIISFHTAYSFAETPYCVCTFMPARSGVTQVRTLGCPSTIITQSVQRPMAQKMPRGASFFSVWRWTMTPAALSAAAIGSPSQPCISFPSRVKVTVFPF